MDKSETPLKAEAVIYSENGKLQIYRGPKPLPFDELIRRFELDRAAEQAKGSNRV